jgi:nitrate/TMAO reductase-like tetraheme cytochrome c subunit|tara:strand:+ start:1037 stop:1348 length:312 start_codon:yes stop_codon:yes gene_type:complete
MQNITTKLTSWGALIGVVCTIGGGFYAWGEFQTRLSAIENKDFVVNESVDLTEVYEKIAEIDKNAVSDIKEIQADIAINKAGIDYLKARIDELETKFGNPLLQ